MNPEDLPESGECIQYFSVAEGRWCGGKFIGIHMGRVIVGSAEGNVGPVEFDQIRTNPKMNWHKLETGGYVVRTQSGFTKARKDWFNYKHPTWNPKQTEGYPRKYPSVIEFRYEFGPDRVFALCTTINDHKAFLSKRLAEIDAD